MARRQKFHKKTKQLFGKAASLKTLKRYCNEIWAELIKVRDGRKCCLCGSSSYLNSHHIISRSVLKTRYESMVGITLCSGCHRLRLKSAHKSPWVLYEWLQHNRPNQYAWFLDNRNVIDNPNPQWKFEDYETKLKQLEIEFEQLDPLVFTRSNYFKFTLEQESIIATEYLETPGLSINYLAQKYKCSEPAIRGLLKRQNISIRRGPKKHHLKKTKLLSLETEEQIIKGYAERGASCRNMAKKYGVNPQTISRLLKLSGIVLKNKGLIACEQHHIGQYSNRKKVNPSWIRTEKGKKGFQGGKNENSPSSS